MASDRYAPARALGGRWGGAMGVIDGEEWVTVLTLQVRVELNSGHVEAEQTVLDPVSRAMGEQDAEGVSRRAYELVVVEAVRRVLREGGADELADKVHFGDAGRLQ